MILSFSGKADIIVIWSIFPIQLSATDVYPFIIIINFFLNGGLSHGLLNKNLSKDI